MKYEEYVGRKMLTHGMAFDDSCLAKKFIPFFESGQRIIVRHKKWGEVERGYVGVTTGWRPMFLLLHRRSDHGSPTLLSNDYEIIGTVNKYLHR